MRPSHSAIRDQTSESPPSFGPAPVPEAEQVGPVRRSPAVKEEFVLLRMAWLRNLETLQRKGSGGGIQHSRRHSPCLRPGGRTTLRVSPFIGTTPSGLEIPGLEFVVKSLNGTQRAPCARGHRLQRASAQRPIPPPATEHPLRCWRDHPKDEWRVRGRTNRTFCPLASSTAAIRRINSSETAPHPPPHFVCGPGGRRFQGGGHSMSGSPPRVSLGRPAPSRASASRHRTCSNRNSPGNVRAANPPPSQVAERHLTIRIGHGQGRIPEQSVIDFAFHEGVPEPQDPIPIAKLERFRGAGGRAPRQVTNQGHGQTRDSFKLGNLMNGCLRTTHFRPNGFRVFKPGERDAAPVERQPWAGAKRSSPPAAISTRPKHFHRWLSPGEPPGTVAGHEAIGHCLSCRGPDPGCGIADLSRRQKCSAAPRWWFTTPWSTPTCCDWLLPGAEDLRRKAVPRSCHPQADLNQLLVEHARAGKVVVRLKGGDPLRLWTRCGRGDGAGGSGDSLWGGTRHFVGGGPPAYAGIGDPPVPIVPRSTCSPGMRIRTNPNHDSTGPRSPGWRHASSLGNRRLADISSGLLRHGTAPKTPVALVRWGTTGRQETMTGTLDSIAAKAAAAQFEAPAVIVIGGVVGLRDRLDWFERRPCFASESSSPEPATRRANSERTLAEAGADVLEIPPSGSRLRRPSDRWLRPSPDSPNTTGWCSPVPTESRPSLTSSKPTTICDPWDSFGSRLLGPLLPRA